MAKAAHKIIIFFLVVLAKRYIVCMGRSTRFANQAVQIRLAKFGCTNRPFYHIVAAKAHRARDNKPLDQIGTYDPLPNQYNEKLVSFNFEKLHKWINQGARPSKIVGMLLGKSNM